jgi:two-component system NarL family sensor kinase
MTEVTALTEPIETRSSARSDARAGEPVARSPQSGARALSDLRCLADGLLRTLEDERARVAMVADEVACVVTMARYLIEDTAQRVARGELEDTTESLQNASARMRDAAQQLGALCSELRPRVLDDLGVVPALSEYIRDFSRQNRAIFFSPRITVSEDSVPAPLKLIVFRIAQAALSNVAKHSQASAARVLLSRFEDELQLVIEDNGVGFDVDRWRHHRHDTHDGCGLGMIHRWVETSGGRCIVKAVPRHGARVQVVWSTRGRSETPLEGATLDVP